MSAVWKLDFLAAFYFYLLVLVQGGLEDIHEGDVGIEAND